MSQKKQVTFEECMENVQTYIKRPENIELIQKAYDFAYEHHKGQFRKSGEPYVIHVIQVANTLALMHCGPKTIAAGLLHDTVEDCEGVTTDTIIELFGEEIATLVDAVTKIGAIKFKDEEKLLGEGPGVDERYVNEILDRKMKLNLESILKFSFFNDLIVMVKTVIAVV